MRRWTDPAFNASACRSIYWSLLPRRDELFAPELFSVAHTEMLQHAGLVSGARQGWGRWYGPRRCCTPCHGCLARKPLPTPMHGPMGRPGAPPWPPHARPPPCPLSRNICPTGQLGAVPH